MVEGSCDVYGGDEFLTEPATEHAIADALLHTESQGDQLTSLSEEELANASIAAEEELAEGEGEPLLKRHKAHSADDDILPELADGAREPFLKRQKAYSAVDDAPPEFLTGQECDQLLQESGDRLQTIEPDETTARDSQLEAGSVAIEEVGQRDADIDEMIDLPAYINRGKLIGKQWANIEAIKTRFTLEHVDIQDNHLVLRGSAASVQSFKEGQGFEGIWTLDCEDKDYEHWRDCVREALPGCIVRAGMPHTVQGPRSITVIAPRTTLIVEGTMETLGNAAQALSKLNGCCALVRVGLSDAKQWEQDNSLHRQASLQKFNLLGVSLELWDDSADPCYIMLKGTLEACLQAKADLSFQLVRQENQEICRGCKLPDAIDDVKSVFTRFFQDAARYRDVRFGISPQREIAVSNFLPIQLPYIRLHTAKVLGKLQIISKIPVPDPTELVRNLRNIKEDHHVEVYLNRSTKVATVIGLLPAVKQGVNHVAAETNSKTWKLCEISSEVLSRFKTTEGCKRAALQALQSAGLWWAGKQSLVSIGPTEDDLLYHSTFEDAKMAANIVAKLFDTSPPRLIPKDLYSELQLERRFKDVC